MALLRRRPDRVACVRFKDIDPAVKARVIAETIDVHDARGQGAVCNLGRGEVGLPAVRQVLLDSGYEGWCVVEQDCDPALAASPSANARANREHPVAIGLNRGILRMPPLSRGLIGGGEGSQIGPAHRMGARLESLSEFRVGALDHRPEAGHAVGSAMGLDPSRD